MFYMNFYLKLNFSSLLPLLSVNPRGNKKVWYDKLIANHKICIILKKMAEGEGERQKESGSFVASSKKN